MEQPQQSPQPTSEEELDHLEMNELILWADSRDALEKLASVEADTLPDGM